MSTTQFLLKLDSKVIKYGLKRTIQLLNACGNPHLSLKSIQIVGTNGKGSTAAMLSNVLINNNYKTGLYTSPHLVTINERIRVNHKKISNNFMDSFIKKYKNELLTIKPSFFEIITVIALSYFVKKKVDFAILETGLGGRLDSVTAALADTLIFTPIDIDHIPLLGNNLNSITREKAGAILSSTSFIFSSHQYPQVKKILIKQAKKHNKQIFYCNNKLEISENFTERHQTENATLAKFVLDKLSKPYELTLKNVTRNLKTTFWPGRIQFINKKPDVVFDVAHNQHSIQAFISYFFQIKKQYRSCYLVLGFERGKQVKDMIIMLYQLFDKVVITETKIRHSMKADNIAKFHKKYFKSSITIELDPIIAIKNTVDNLNSDEIVVILGSHYFGPHISKLYKNCFDIK